MTGMDDRPVPAGGASGFDRDDWAWPPDRLAEAARLVGDLVTAHLSSLSGSSDRAAFAPYPGGLARAAAAEPLPVAGMSVEQVLRRFAERVEPWPFGNGSPRFFGWVNGPPDPLGVHVETLAAAMNPSVAGGNHAATYIELQVVRWVAELLGYPAGGGLLVSGGSAATVHALAAARHRTTGGTDRTVGLAGGPRLTVYASEEAHSCVRKAVELLGLGSEGLRQVPTDDGFRLRPDALSAAVAADRAAGARPMAVVASAGTTNTGAVDPLDAAADVCAAEDLWLHVDGAYGAPGRLDPRCSPLFAGLERADSLAVDAHKWLYAPYEAGMIFVRDAPALRATFSFVPPYLRGYDEDESGVYGPPWFSEYGTQQTRGFRALKVWAALLHRGRAGYAAAVGHDLDMAASLAERVRADPRFELLAAGLSVVCFRYLPAGPGPWPPERVDDVNRTLLADVQTSGRAFCGSTTLRGVFALRACVINPLTTPADVEVLLDAVLTAGAAAS